MKVVAVNGSPRKAGNTARMLKKMTKMAEEKGAEIKYFDLAEIEFEDCRACRQCKKTDTCSIKDGLDVVKEEIRSADVLLLGSPVYMGAETGLMKCFVDRLYALYAPTDQKGTFKSRLPSGKKGFVVFTCGMSDGDKLYNYLNTRYFSLLSKNLGFKEVRTFIVGGANPNEDLTATHMAKTVLEEAKRLIEA
ncbi:MAG TPA: flavodoxin family protein [Methanomassiliicoccales archaeon]|nr:flavodoxin family protein [Methanomassiliicoccales archaeon]